MSRLLNQIRLLTVFFIAVLIISGVTAFPVYTELQWIISAKIFSKDSALQQWLNHVFVGVKYMHDQYPFIFYGFDWLGFAHLAIAVLFIGVYKHPVHNKWIVQWAMIICISVLPLAFIAGSIRGIPLFHILIDSSFGLIGLIPLRIMQVKIIELKKYRRESRSA